MMMKSRIIILFTMQFLFSCKGNGQELYLKAKLEEVFAENTSLAINKDTLFILESKSSQDYFFKLFFNNRDTFKLSKYKSINLSEKILKLAEIKDSELYLKSIKDHRFQYSLPPTELSNKFNKDEILVSFLKDSSNWYYLTQNKKSGVYKINVAKVNEINNGYSLTLSSTLEKPDFLIFSNTEYQYPIILLFKNTYFMNNNLVELNILEVKSPIKKRGF